MAWQFIKTAAWKFEEITESLCSDHDSDFL